MENLTDVRSLLPVLYVIMSVDKRQASVAMYDWLDGYFQSYLISQHENIYIYERDISFIIKIFNRMGFFCNWVFGFFRFKVF